MLLKITPTMLATLAGGHLSEDACKAICDYYEDCFFDGGRSAPSIGDIIISFCEMTMEDAVAYDEVIIAELDNGNVLIMH